MAPVVVSAIYYYNYASSQYVTETHYIIRGNDKTPSDVLGMLTGIPGSSASSADSLIAQDYILSRDFLNQAKQRINIREMYTGADIDWWASLRPDLLSYLIDPNEPVSDEDLLAYWQNNIMDIIYDSNSGITTLVVTAFKPEDTVKISKAVLASVDNFVNNLSSKSRTDALNTAELETSVAKKELDAIRAKIARFGAKEQVVVPEQRVLADEGIVTALKGQLIAAEAELSHLNSFMQPRSMEVRAARNKVATLKRQISKQTSISKRKGKKVTRVIQKTNTFQSELLFAEKVYLSALSSLRIARLEVSRKQRYLDIIVHPQLPDESQKPDKLMSILSVFFISFMLWGIVSLLFATVKDHIGWV
ncbi:MAG: hypothetical protein DSZ29_04875 [Aquificaceae bacterium]|nr:MAG: hypothetical protein DSZ29_04875 [Aquificaceae bacterium]